MKGASMIAPLGVRLPEELKDKIKDLAKDNGRSVNAEIVVLLEGMISSIEGGNSVKSLSSELEASRNENKKLKKIIALLEDQSELLRRQCDLLTEQCEFYKKPT